MADLQSTPQKIPNFIPFRLITSSNQDSGNPALYSKGAGIACADFTHVVVQVGATGGAIPTVKVYYWNNAINQYVYAYTPANQPSVANSGFQFVLDAIGQYIYIEVTGVISGTAQLWIGGSYDGIGSLAGQSSQGNSSGVAARDSALVTIGTGLNDTSQLLANAKPVGVGRNGLVSLHVVIDGGSARNNPTDNPAGVLHLYASSDSVDPNATGADTMGYDLVSTAESDLAAVSPNGTNLLQGYWASFEVAQGTFIKFTYSYTSGGGTGSRIRLGVVTS